MRTLNHPLFFSFQNLRLKTENKMIKKYFLKGAQVLNVVQMNTAGYDTDISHWGKQCYSHA